MSPFSKIPKRAISLHPTVQKSCLCLQTLVVLSLSLSELIPPFCDHGFLQLSCSSVVCEDLFNHHHQHPSVLRQILPIHTHWADCVVFLNYSRFILSPMQILDLDHLVHYSRSKHIE